MSNEENQVEYIKPDMQIVRESFAVVQRAHAEFVGVVESLNTRLGTALAIVPALSALILFEMPGLLLQHPPLTRCALFVMFLVGATLVLVSAAYLVNGLMTRTVPSAYNLQTLVSQAGDEYRDEMKFLRQQTVNLAASAEQHVDSAKQKGDAFNSGATLAVVGFLLLIVTRVILEFNGG